MSFRTLLCAAMAAALAGCATQEPFVHPLAASEAQALRQPTIYIAIPQKKLEAQYLYGVAPNANMVPIYVNQPMPANVPPPTAGQMLGLGVAALLVGVAIDHAAKDSAIDAEQKYLVTVQHPLQGYNPRQAIADGLVSALRKQPWAAASPVHVVDQLPDQPAAQDSARLEVDYALSPDFRALVMRATVQINHHVTTAKGDSDAAVYRDRLIYLSPEAVLPTKTKADEKRLYAREMSHWNQGAINAEIAKLNAEGANGGPNAAHERYVLQSKMHAHELALQWAMSPNWTYQQAMRYRADYWSTQGARQVKAAITQGTQALADMLAMDLQGTVAKTHPITSATMPGWPFNIAPLPDGQIASLTPFGLVARQPGTSIPPALAMYPVTP